MSEQSRFTIAGATYIVDEPAAELEQRIAGMLKDSGSAFITLRGPKISGSIDVFITADHPLTIQEHAPRRLR